MIKLKKQLEFVLFLCKSLKLIPKYFKENKLTISNIRNFIQGNYKLFLFNDLELFMREQIYFRYSKVDSECKLKKECFCGCELFGLINVEKSCERNCYPTMMDLDTWNIYKSVYSLTSEKLNELKLNYEFYKLLTII